VKLKLQNGGVFCQNLATEVSGMSTAGVATARANDEALFRADLLEKLRQGLSHDLRDQSLQIDQSVRVLSDLTVSMEGNAFTPSFNFLEQEIVIFGTASVDAQLASYFRRASALEQLVLPRVVIEVKYNGITSHTLMTYTTIANRIKAIFGSTRYYLVLRYDNKSSATLLRHGMGFDRIAQLQMVSGRRGQRPIPRYATGDFQRHLQTDSSLREKLDQLIATLRYDLIDSKII
jgi:hypothetical protein